MKSPLAIVLCAALASVPGCKKDEGGAPGKRPPPPVEVYRVEAQPFVRTIQAVGTLKSPDSTEIAAEIAGKVIALDVPEGQEVKKGHVLARLDSSISRAELAIARARLRGADDTLDRVKALEKENVASGQELDNAHTAKRTARGEVARHTASLDKTVIRAPFSGLLGIREVSLGTFVAPGAPITRITRIKPLELEFSVPERHVADLKTGQTVHGVVGSCDHQFTGQIRVVDPNVDRVTRSVRVEATVPNSDQRLRPGMSARVRIEIEKVPKALLIPEEALVRKGTDQRVYVVTKNGTAEAKEVELGEFRSGMVEVTSGLSRGARVIAKGHQKVRPGGKVTAKKYEAVENPNLELGMTDAQVDCWF